MKKENDLRGVFGLLLPEIGRAVSEAGYHTPSPIQEQSIPSLLEGRDMLGCAQTGTGKTAAFSLPILQHLQKSGTNRRKVRALVLTPTRELAAQVSESVRDYGRYLPFRAAAIFGGVSINTQIAKLKKGVDVVVETGVDSDHGAWLCRGVSGNARTGSVHHRQRDKSDALGTQF